MSQVGDENGRLLAEQVWSIVGLGNDNSRRLQDHNKRIGEIMKKLGFKRERCKVNGRQQYCYVRGNEDERKQGLRLNEPAMVVPPAPLNSTS